MFREVLAERSGGFDPAVYDFDDAVKSAQGDDPAHLWRRVILTIRPLVPSACTAPNSTLIRRNRRSRGRRNRHR